MRPPGLPALAFALLAVAATLAARADEPPAAVPPEVQAALDRISPDSLRGHVSFLASDLLEGRGTPSKGLDLAAEYLASQFRRAGLEPLGDDGYFQTAPWTYLAPDPGSFACELKLGGDPIRVAESQVSGFLPTALDLPPTAALKVDTSDAAALEALTPDAVAGKVVLAELPNPAKVARPKAAATNAARMAFLRRIDELKPALVLDIDRDPVGATGLRQETATPRAIRPRPKTPLIRVQSPSLAARFDALPAGPVPDATVSLRVGEPKERTGKVRNVVGVLRGTAAGPEETFVLLSAHYDHLGIGPRDESGDGIYNGANDDASGTASVVEIASALATLKARPARSLVFVAFYGEERGLIGSQYYADHPVVPLARTVGAINLEQVGRTDDSDGPRVSAATVTGYDFSDVGATLHAAGAAVGIDVTKHPTKSDAYFGASDNASLARAGVPAHTISVAFAFPDYHGADDEWDRLDYDNMAKVDRMAALGLLRIADGPAPHWDEATPKAAPYRKAASVR